MELGGRPPIVSPARSPESHARLHVGIVAFALALASVAGAASSPTMGPGSKRTSPPAVVDERPAVLVLNSYHPGYTWSDHEVEGILETLRRHDRYWQPFVEYLDTKHFPAGEQFPLLEQLLVRKYGHRRIPVVVACDDPAFDFALANREAFAPGASIVFCGINHFTPATTRGAPRVTGVAETMDVTGTIASALSLRPRTREIVVVHDRTVTGLATRRTFDEAAPRFAGRVAFRVLPDVPMEEILAALGGLPQDHAVLALSFSRDAAGKVFDHEKVAELFAHNSTVPVFVVHEERIGGGVVGGSVLGGREHGRSAGELALRVLSGTAASAIPVVTRPSTRFVFDWQGLARFGIAEAALPAGSVVVNRPESFYRRYRTLVLGTAGIVTGLCTLVGLLGVNVLRRRRAESALEAQRSFLKDALDGLPDPVVVLDPDHGVRLANRSARAIAPDSGGAPLLLHAPSEPCPSALDPCPVREVIEKQAVVSFERRHRDADGSSRTFEITAAPLKSADGGLTGVIASAHDITDLRRTHALLVDREERLVHLAHHDPLTGLPNRLLFHDRFEQALARARRHRTGVALLFLDLDRFKNINDTLGHETGDEFLKAASERVRRCVRTGDTVARVGGDEFTIVVEGRSDDPRAASVARNVIRALDEPIAVGTHRLYVGTSIGIAVHPEDGEDAATLVKNADAAMYLAKERGRGNYQFFTEALNQRANRQLALENRLRHALATGGLDLHYQPLVDLRLGVVVGSEALLRWDDAELGRVSPSEFIPVAEETGLIGPIGEIVLRRACRETKALQAEGFPDLRVAVNISARQFWQSDLTASVASALDESGLSGRFLELELTESLLMPGGEDALGHLSALRALGVRLSLDDFGTGYSSLSTLRRLPFDTLKVAQEFVRDLSVDAGDASIVRAILSMAETLGFRVIAEGVETDAHVAFFRDSGCDLAQGHFFSPAVSGPDYREILLRGGFPAPGVA